MHVKFEHITDGIFWVGGSTCTTPTLDPPLYPPPHFRIWFHYTLLYLYLEIGIRHTTYWHTSKREFYKEHRRENIIKKFVEI